MQACVSFAVSLGDRFGFRGECIKTGCRWPEKGGREELEGGLANSVALGFPIIQMCLIDGYRGWGSNDFHP